MFRVELKGLAARKLRLVLTAFAIALGVTLMAGTYIFTDTINSSFDSIFQESRKGIDVAVTPKPAFGKQIDAAGTLSLPASYLERVRAVPGAASAAGGIFGNGTVFDKQGKRLNKGGAPSFIASVKPAPFGAFTVAEGRMPRNAGELALDKAAADRADYALGDKVAVQGQTPRRSYTLVGTVRLGGANSFGGATATVLTLPEAQRVTGYEGRFDEIDAAARPGVSADALRGQVAGALRGEPVNVRTGVAEADQQSSDLRDQLGPLRTALLAFAFISLFVGGFIIFNTFSITVAQRTREFALLRVLGATRRQVLRAVVGESAVLGIGGSIVGVLGGLAVAPGLKGLMQLLGAELPANGLVIQSRTVIVSMIAGTVVTLIGGIAPALRATRVPPVAALREGVALPVGRRARLVTPVAVLFMLLGLAGIVTGLFGGLKTTPTLTFLGIGVALVFFGVALLSPRLVRPLASLIGAPLERFQGVTGRLARENTTRLPGRTAVTAAALMVGVTLVTFVSVFAAGLKQTLNEAVDNGLRGDLILQTAGGNTEQGFTDATTPALERVPGVAGVSPVRFATGRVVGRSGNVSVTGIDPATFGSAYRSGWQQGDDSVWRALRPGDAVVGKGYAEDHSVHVGDRLRLRSATGSTIGVRVTGILHDKGQVVGEIALPNSVLTRDFGQRDNAFSILRYRPGADGNQVKRAVDAELERAFPAVEAKTGAEFKDQQAGQVNTLLGVFYALLGLAIIVSLFGIVNTLVLSIHERTRELGMLRVIGMHRRQVKRMVRGEAVITALIGGVLGIVLGLGLALLFIQAIDDFSVAIPYGTIVAVFVVSGLAGVGAAILPARRAAKLDMLQALAYE